MKSGVLEALVITKASDLGWRLLFGSKRSVVVVNVGVGVVLERTTSKPVFIQNYRTDCRDVAYLKRPKRFFLLIFKNLFRHNFVNDRLPRFLQLHLRNVRHGTVNVVLETVDGGRMNACDFMFFNIEIFKLINNIYLF